MSLLQWLKSIIRIYRSAEMQFSAIDDILQALLSPHLYIVLQRL